MSHYDLHSHSYCSDGALSPTELVQQAHKCGIDYLALTDHDTVNGVAEAQQAAATLPIQLITGVEISSTHRLATSKKDMSVHVVGLDFADIDSISADLQSLQIERATRAVQICEKIQTITKKDIYPQVLASAQNNPQAITRTHIAKTLVEQQIVDRYQMAFTKYLSQGKVAYVPMDTLTMYDAIVMIHKSGGQAVLAHPTRYGLSGANTRRLIGDFKRLGGDATELPPKTEPSATRALVDRCVEIHQLMVSVGSDFHGAHIPWIKLGNVPTVGEGQVPVWSHFKNS